MPSLSSGGGRDLQGTDSAKETGVTGRDTAFCTAVSAVLLVLVDMLPHLSFLGL